MNHLLLVAPGITLLAIVVVALLAYGGLRVTSREQSSASFLAGFLVWSIAPLERWFDGRVGSTELAVVALVLRVATAVLAGMGWLSGAGWTFALSGIAAALSWRFAVDRGVTSPARALFEAVAGRWGELLVFFGYAWALHESPWLVAVIAALTGWTMVSYTQARAEGLGIQFWVGASQHAERIVVVAVGTEFAAWAPEDLVAPILGATMLACAITSLVSAVYRGFAVYKLLAERESSIK